MAYSASAGDAPPTSRYFPETGCLVEGAFLDFFDRYGVDLCGLPLSNRVLDGGVPTQYFQRLALEEPTPGQVRLKALGDEVLRLRQERPTSLGPAGPLPTTRLVGSAPFTLVNQLDRLPQHPTARYPSRPLEYIRHLIIHHSGVPASVGPEVIAGYHVTDLNWPGIGYHFVVDATGQVYQTNALTTAAYHARQFNTSGVGIALLGNFNQAVPPAAQLDAAAELCAWLVRGLDLPLDAIKGHRELIAVTCPGEYWLQGPAWKDSLVGRVARLLRGEPLAEPAPVAAMPAMPPAAWLSEANTAPTLTPPAPAIPTPPAETAWTAPTTTPVAEEAATTPPAPVETTTEATPVAPIAPVAPTPWAESAEQSIATAAMVAALKPPTPAAPADAPPGEPTTTSALPDAPPTDTPAPAPRPWWMPVSDPFPAPEPPAETRPSISDTVPLDVTPPSADAAAGDGGLNAAPAESASQAARSEARAGQTDAPQTDEEDVPFFPRSRPDHHDPT